MPFEAGFAFVWVPAHGSSSDKKLVFGVSKNKNATYFIAYTRPVGEMFDTDDDDDDRGGGVSGGCGGGGGVDGGDGDMLQACLHGSAVG